MRASIYNAMPIEGVQGAGQFMRDFEAHDMADTSFRILTLNSISRWA